jgi:hypothetical protein
LISCELDFDDHEKTDAGLVLVYTYLEELHKRVPLNPPPPVPTPTEDDSQNYGSDSGFAELVNPRSKFVEVCMCFFDKNRPSNFNRF